jgi:hypothetical protein
VEDRRRGVTLAASPAAITPDMLMTPAEIAELEGAGVRSIIDGHEFSRITLDWL